MEVSEYVVTLGIRPAELNGLKELPANTKDALTPLVLLAPWLATSPLAKALDKFEEAYPNRPYFVDIDSYYQMNDKLNEAKEQWALLAQKPADINFWWAYLTNFPNAQPCLLMANQTIENVRTQILWARSQNRTFCLRFNLADGNGSGIPPWIPELVQELVDEGTVDYTIIFEFGWVKNPLILSAIAAGYMSSFLSEIQREIPVVVSCTSFPKAFTAFDGLEECAFSNRELIEQIRQTTNYPRLVYGDWGTTKPRAYGVASPPKKRIDYPGDRAWVIARGQNEEITLHTAAKWIVGSDYWNGSLGVWGEQLIHDTSLGLPFAIDTMQKMYSARINIHLHRQAFYGHLPPPDALDEEWNDDEL